MNSPDGILFSVVIAVHSPEPSRFQRVLEALRRASSEAASAGIGSEIIVVRNGGSLIPPDLLAAGGSVRLIVEDKPGILWARTAGTGAASGDWIVFVDDDNIVADNFLLEAARFSSDTPEVGVFGGRLLGEFEEPPARHLQPALAFLALRDFGDDRIVVKPDEKRTFDVPGAGMVMARPVAERFRAMVEAGTLNGVGRVGNDLSSGDDTACCMIARRMGYALGYAPRLKLRHIMPARRVRADYLAGLVKAIGGSAAKLDAIFDGPETLRVSGPAQLLARYAVHMIRHGIRTGRITAGWHTGYRQQALRERQRSTLP